MGTIPQNPQRIEDRKAQKLIERIEKMRVRQRKDIGEESPAPKQRPSAA
jgi:hypothetical protein